MMTPITALEMAFLSLWFFCFVLGKSHLCTWLPPTCLPSSPFAHLMNLAGARGKGWMRRTLLYLFPRGQPGGRMSV